MSPNRPLVFVLGLLGSLAIAFALAGLREAGDTSVRSADDLRSLVEVAPLAAIPVIRTREEIAGARRAVTRVWLGAVTGVIALALAVHFLYRPLDIVWFTMLRRMGI